MLSDSQNSCLVLDEGTKFIGCSSWLLGYAAAISVNDPLHLYFGKSFCSIVDYLSGLGVIQNYLGGVGIAWMRYIYIKFSPRVPIGENTLAVLIGAVDSAILFGISCFWYVVYTPTYPDFEPICLGRPLDDPLRDYDAPNSLNLKDFRLACIGLAILLALLLSSEMAMYASIYKYLIEHDKEMVMVLSGTTIKKRMKKNAIDLFGHTMIFFADGCWLLMKAIEIWLAKGSSLVELRNRRWIFKCVNMSMYGIASIVHIIISSSLRSDTIAIFRKLSLPFIRILTYFHELKCKKPSVAPKLLH